MPIPSEIQTALAGAIGQGFDPAVKQISAAIEDDLLDPGRFGSLGHQLADGARRGNVGAGFKIGLQPAVESRGRRQSASCRVVDDLREDVPGGTKYREARTVVGGAAQIAPNP